MCLIPAHIKHTPTMTDLY